MKFGESTVRLRLHCLNAAIAATRGPTREGDVCDSLMSTTPQVGTANAAQRLSPSTPTFIGPEISRVVAAADMSCRKATAAGG